MRPPTPQNPGAPDPYVVLGLAPSASQEEIKQAYFVQVRAHPPEREPEAFKQVRAAYDQLKAPEKRLETDMLRFQTWAEPALSTPKAIELGLNPSDVIRAARACSDLARNDWREDFREVKP